MNYFLTSVYVSECGVALPRIWVKVVYLVQEKVCDTDCRKFCGKIANLVLLQVASSTLTKSNILAKWLR